MALDRNKGKNSHHETEVQVDVTMEIDATGTESDDETTTEATLEEKLAVTERKYRNVNCTWPPFCSLLFVLKG